MEREKRKSGIKELLLIEVTSSLLSSFSRSHPSCIHPCPHLTSAVFSSSFRFTIVFLPSFPLSCFLVIYFHPSFLPVLFCPFIHPLYWLSSSHPSHPVSSHFLSFSCFPIFSFCKFSFFFSFFLDYFWGIFSFVGMVDIEETMQLYSKCQTSGKRVLSSPIPSFLLFPLSFCVP